MPDPVRRHLTELLDGLKEQVMAMGLHVEDMVADAVRALIEKDERLAGDVIDRDRQTNTYEMQVYATCVDILARETPVAKDLRFVVSAMTTATELERVGDDAVSIAKKALTTEEPVPPEAVEALRELSQMSRSMLVNVLKAFATGDEQMLEQVIESDSEVDRTWKSIRRRMREFMTEHPEKLRDLEKILSACHHLEYVADHAESIAERIEFVRSGDLARFLTRED